MGNMWGTWAKMWQNIWEPFRAKLEENNGKKGNSGKTYVTIPGEIWCGKFGEI
jgi:hypothetical protein